MQIDGQGLIDLANAITPLLYSGEMTDRFNRQNLRDRIYDIATGRFTQFDRYRGSNSDPASLHKYLYTHANPINGIDPSGQFELTLTNMLLALGVAATLHAVAQAAISIRPFREAIRSIGNVLPDAGIIGVQGTSETAARLLHLLAAFSFPIPLGPVNAALALYGGTAVTVGCDVVFEIASSQIAIFLYAGAGAGIGTGADGNFITDNTPGLSSGIGVGDSFTVYSGLVWNMWNVGEYGGWFHQLSYSCGSWAFSPFPSPDNYFVNNPGSAPLGITVGYTEGNKHRSVGAFATYYVGSPPVNSTMDGAIGLAAAWTAATAWISTKLGFTNPYAALGAVALGSFWPYTKWRTAEDLYDRQHSDKRPPGWSSFYDAMPEFHPHEYGT